MAETECNEYAALVGRKHHDYSVGHQIMYLAPIMMISGKPNRILDVGFGIGFGLRHMLASQAVGTYVGYEPNVDSFNYVRSHAPVADHILLINEPFANEGRNFDYSFCIEMIEHVASKEERNRILSDLSMATDKTLFLSTPDRTRNDHGIYSEVEMRQSLYAAGFDNVTCIPEQWTNLYIAS